MGKKRAAQPQEPAKDTKKQKISKKTSQKSQPEVHESQKSHESQKPSLKYKQKTQKGEQFDFFTGEFYDKLNSFTALYRDFLRVKNSSDETNIDTQLFEVTKKVQQTIEAQASTIFKQQLQDTQSWIQSEIQKINEDIKVIETAYENNRESLMKTGAFTEDEVKKQLSPIQAKVEGKKDTCERYERLLARSKQIYQ